MKQRKEMCRIKTETAIKTVPIQKIEEIFKPYDVTVNTPALNVRGGHGTDYPVIKVLMNDRKIHTVTDESENGQNWKYADGYGKLLSQKYAQFDNNYQGCKTVGIPCGAHRYSHAGIIPMPENANETPPVTAIGVPALRPDIRFSMHLLMLG